MAKLIAWRLNEWSLLGCGRYTGDAERRGGIGIWSLEMAMDFWRTMTVCSDSVRTVVGAAGVPEDGGGRLGRDCWPSVLSVWGKEQKKHHVPFATLEYIVLLKEIVHVLPVYFLNILPQPFSYISRLLLPFHLVHRLPAPPARHARSVTTYGSRKSHFLLQTRPSTATYASASLVGVDATINNTTNEHIGTRLEQKNK